MSEQLEDNRWLEALRKECKERTQVVLAEELEISPSTMSQILSETYPGDTTRVAAWVKGKYLEEKSHCPAAWNEKIPMHSCVLIQKRVSGGPPFSSELHLRARDECPRCPNRLYGFKSRPKPN